MGNDGTGGCGCCDVYFFLGILGKRDHHFFFKRKVWGKCDYKISTGKLPQVFV